MNVERLTADFTDGKRSSVQADVSLFVDVFHQGSGCIEFEVDATPNMGNILYKSHIHDMTREKLAIELITHF